LCGEKGGSLKIHAPDVPVRDSRSFMVSVWHIFEKMSRRRRRPGYRKFYEKIFYDRQKFH